MAPPPKLLTPAQVLARTGITIASNEVAYHEGAAVIVFPAMSTSAMASFSSASVLPGESPGQGPDAAAFLNPVQEFNRDLSIAAIRTWEADMNAERKEKRLRGWAKKRAKGKGKAKNGKDKQPETGDAEVKGAASIADCSAKPADHGKRVKPPHIPPYRFTILEALAATGLRSIRYAKEIDNIRFILANDLSAPAIETMRRNVTLNFPPGEDTIAPGELAGAAKAGDDAAASLTKTSPTASVEESAAESTSLIRINEGDALSVMYQHRTPAHAQFDVVDVDPYGSASMFLDSSVQAVADGGLLCITCTDLAVLAGGQYPEKAYTLYGGMSLRSEYSHEIALRLVLHAISTAAARYGRYIQPVLSLSIDFYVRVFVRVWTSQVETKRLAAQTALLWSCQGCGNNATLPMGRRKPGPKSKDGKDQTKYSNGGGPPISPRCDECGGSWLMGGPLWTGPLHDTGFCHRLLDIVAKDPSKFKTAPRIRGMVSTAAQELGNTNTPPPAASTDAGVAEGTDGNKEEDSLMSDAASPLFFFTPSRLSSAFHSLCPPLSVYVNALLNAGYKVSRSHCMPGSLKTDCPRPKLYDLQRNWLKAQQIAEAGRANEEAKEEMGADQGYEKAQGDADNRKRGGGAADSNAAVDVDGSRKLKLSKRIQKMNAASPAFRLNTKPITTFFDINTIHPAAQKILAAELESTSYASCGGDGADKDANATGEDKAKGRKKEKLVRYPSNPLPNWGPGTAAKTTVAPPKGKASNAAKRSAEGVQNGDSLANASKKTKCD
ncbi:TRM-domain-containing protein [Tilletiaria anomala UBC 951]|uniref:tRNA (guanine(26)-N(2))-dimethyltransferase n=1 Tax=Tilletiaria anomala (strain ATCC 24038 / CBS 436.72 / UBC 951) TaxID=1037660 RepID=A0A066V4K2_TILAU|nr:TRM-domain-containing protein [Tilletiaria anomala UBC 951]KDN36662.1 TRM-domain-containing protein [Tilletiaria anomala UBC 951]